VSDVVGAAPDPVEGGVVPAVVLAPADVDGAPLEDAVPDRPLAAAVVRGAPGAAVPPEPPGPPGAGARGGAGGAVVGVRTVGFGAAVGFGGGGAGAAGGAIAGRRPAPNAHPSTVPAGGSKPPAPSEL
jgi:hypothetical protein